MTAKKAQAKTAVVIVETEAEIESKRIAQAINEHFAKNESMSAIELASILDVDDKQVRAKLRTNKFRDQSQFKNATWKLNREQVTRFMSLKTQKVSATS